MSAQNRATLAATIYNMQSDAGAELFEELAALSDEELENILNEIMRR